MGTLTPAAGGGSLRVFEIGFGAVVGNLVIGGIDFHQHRTGLHILVVEDIELDDVAGDAGADGIDVAVDFGIIGRFVAGDIAVDEKSHDQQHDDGDDDGDAEAGTARCAKDEYGNRVPSRQRLVRLSG